MRIPRPPMDAPRDVIAATPDGVAPRIPYGDRMREDPGPPSAAHRKAEEQLREFALGYPEAVEEFPWGERAIKVRKKVFVFMVANGTGLHLSTKLPDSAAFALSHPFATPTGYGLGKSGWVSAAFTPGQRPPVDLLCDWIDESYRAIAPKTLVKQLPE
jgi:predicted DNA-binding protein (MmcQ/YjbR family)